ncbi:matrixin family metalloprotease [Oligoflexus tunisiensis]|uniref:matrixin family metalloprotease n=1 Tax=Oligoflexus tunisiensis TaxID=708132 RepID=UPI00114CC6A3|nr:matrixin family metalloprotease [Oligoflexus tunisiensis]
MLRHTFFVLVSLFVFSACQEYHVVEVKDFRIHAETQDPDLQRAIKVLAQRYNRDVGTQALTIVDREEESNSRIRFTAGLHDDGHKLGLGKWITTTQKESSLTLKGEKNTRTVAYAMEIEFDLENFERKAAQIDDASSEEAQHLYHLFCHEIGHGLQMEHSRESSNIMYPTIPETSNRYIDYKAYFNRVRSFLSR